MMDRQKLSLVTSAHDEEDFLQEVKSAADVETSIILPVYNEESILENSVKRLCEFLDNMGMKYELIICDDESSDGTRQVSRTLCSKNDNILYLNFHKRVGKGGTIRNASKVTRGRTLVCMDADLSTNLRHLPPLVEGVKKTRGVVIGVRNPSAATRGSFLRAFLSIGYNHLVRLMFWTAIPDYQCGFKAVNAEAAELLFPRIRSDGFLFDTELIVNAMRLGVPVTVMPVKWRDSRPKGTSKVIPIRAIITMLADLVILRLSQLNGRTILKLKEVQKGIFTSETANKHDGTFRATGMVTTLKKQKILNVLGKIYFTIAFSGVKKQLKTPCKESKA